MSPIGRIYDDNFLETGAKFVYIMIINLKLDAFMVGHYARLYYFYFFFIHS